MDIKQQRLTYVHYAAHFRLSAPPDVVMCFHRHTAKVEEDRIKKLKAKTEIDSYAECYPG